jgi:hypothetical protein
MVCFEVDGFSPEQTVDRWKDLGIVASTMPAYKHKYPRVNTESVEYAGRSGRHFGRDSFTGLAAGSKKFSAAAGVNNKGSSIVGLPAEDRVV